MTSKRHHRDKASPDSATWPAPSDRGKRAARAGSVLTFAFDGDPAPDSTRLREGKFELTEEYSAVKL
ncbi:hypothetical protein ACIQF6_28165 [Kitasatospora sp. NPDC092948]|uniref:hypothetical protein n=1 Tax=Kitasatospora sp. NPDC092948 TaxID=3364088 RepID=UPI0038129418